MDKMYSYIICNSNRLNLIFINPLNTVGVSPAASFGIKFKCRVCSGF